MLWSVPRDDIIFDKMNRRFDMVAFGEILWDVIDGVPHLGGAPFNFAAHAAPAFLF